MTRVKLGWKYNAKTETFETPCGPIRLFDLLQAQHERSVGAVDLPGRWKGWKFRQGCLIPPATQASSKIRITPQTLLRYEAWVRGEHLVAEQAARKAASNVVPIRPGHDLKPAPEPVRVAYRPRDSVRRRR